jgi:hypothetical protein
MTNPVVQKQAFDYFVSMGWSPAQSAGIVANLIAESNLNPNASGDGGAAWGLAQWHGDRQANFAALIGKDIRGSSLEDQLAFVHAELQGAEKSAGDALSACITAAEAGAIVSERYERPADQAGEAKHRGELAESILAQYGTAQEAPQATPDVSEPQPTDTAASAPQGSPMGAIATFLPLIMQLIPGLAKIPGLGAVVGAVSGQPVQPQPQPGPPPVFTGPAAGGSMHAADYLQLAQIILDTFVKAVPGAQNPAMAVGMAQADPTVLANAQQAVMSHPDVVAQLNAQIPVFDAIAKYDAQTNAAVIAGANAAAMRAVHDPYDVAPVLVKNITGMTWAILLAMIVGIGIAMGLKAIFPEVPDWAAMIIPAMTLVIGQIMKERGAVVAYRWDGTPQSNAANAVNAQLVQMNKDGSAK